MRIRLMDCRFPHIYTFYFTKKNVKKKRKKEKKKTDADTICGNKLLPVTQK